MLQSCYIAIKQLHSAEKIFNYFLHKADTLNENDCHAIFCSILNFFCGDDSSNVEQSFNHSSTQFYQKPGGGLLCCLNHLSALGLYIDSSEAMNLQIQIVHLMHVILLQTSKLGYSKSKNWFVEKLTRFGLVRSVLQFTKYQMDIFREVVKSKRFASFLSTDHNRITTASRSLWQALLLLSNDDISEGILLSGLIDVILDDWIRDTSIVSVASSKESEPDAYIVRNEAIELLRIILHQSFSSPLVKKQVVLSIIEKQLIEKFLGDIKSAQTSKKISMTARSSLHMLNIFASFNDESMSKRLHLHNIPNYLIMSSIFFSDMHPFTNHLWLSWAQMKQPIGDQEAGYFDPSIDDIAVDSQASNANFKITKSSKSVGNRNGSLIDSQRLLYTDKGNVYFM
jgi:hypothetical protein